jgi:hypothetical protein
VREDRLEAHLRPLLVQLSFFKATLAIGCIRQVATLPMFATDQVAQRVLEGVARLLEERAAEAVAELSDEELDAELCYGESEAERLGDLGERIAAGYAR